MSNSEHVSVLIAGSGCAGHTAAIYAARADLKPLVLEGNEPGGQLSLTSDVENFPGFPEGVGGFDLIENMKQQAQRFGARYEYGLIARLEDGGPPYTVELDNGKRITADSLILATGARARRLDVPGEGEMFGRGVSSCATCDGAFFRDQVVTVIGGGDSAMEEALFLTRFATKVIVIHRREALRASKIMQQRALEHAKIEFLWNSEVVSVLGDHETGAVSGVEVITHPEGAPSDKLDDPRTERRTVACDGMFLGIGHIPNTDFLGGRVTTDEEGYIVTVKGHSVTEDVKTNLEGVYACGDVVDKRYRQAITAAGMGCKAAMEAEEYLASKLAPTAVG
ncbi:MAG: thioredoxin-disulfide reductase [Vulcanimicrobiota bacterium]